jgi:hypothetical protein
LSDWLLDHSRALEIVVGIDSGAIFLAKDRVTVIA